jgi:phosphatidylserine synthase
MTYGGKEITDMGLGGHNSLLIVIPTFLLIASGIVRLAWFNVSEDTGAYEGIPVPVTATILVSLMLADYLAFLVSGTPNWFNYFMHYFIPVTMVILAWSNVTDRFKYGKTIRKKSGGMKFLFLFSGIFITALGIMVLFFRQETALITLIITISLWSVWIWFLVLGLRTAKEMKLKKMEDN